MYRITLLVALAIGLSPLLDSAPGTAAPADAPAKPGAGEWGGRAGLQVAWSASDARQKAADYLGSHHAHREAIASTRQCQSCHGAGAAASVLDYVDAAALHPKGPWIGVSVGPADGVLRSQLRLPEGTGVVVTQIVPDSPAQSAGVEVDDVLLSVNGKPITGHLVPYAKAGEVVQVDCEA